MQFLSSGRPTGDAPPLTTLLASGLVGQPIGILPGAFGGQPPQLRLHGQLGILPEAVGVSLPRSTRAARRRAVRNRPPLTPEQMNENVYRIRRAVIQ